jgi:hypothetical protein
MHSHLLIARVARPQPEPEEHTLVVLGGIVQDLKGGVWTRAHRVEPQVPGVLRYYVQVPLDIFGAEAEARRISRYRAVQAQNPKVARIDSSKSTTSRLAAYSHRGMSPVGQAGELKKRIHSFRQEQNENQRCPSGHAFRQQFFMPVAQGSCR